MGRSVVSKSDIHTRCGHCMVSLPATKSATREETLHASCSLEASPWEADVPIIHRPGEVVDMPCAPRVNHRAELKGAPRRHSGLFEGEGQ